jgi:hypothetical protein
MLEAVVVVLALLQYNLPVVLVEEALEGNLALEMDMAQTEQTPLAEVAAEAELEAALQAVVMVVQVLLFLDYIRKVNDE